MHVLETKRVIGQLCGPIGSIAGIRYAFVGIIVGLSLVGLCLCLCLCLCLGDGGTPAVRGPNGLRL